MRPVAHGAPIGEDAQVHLELVVLALAPCFILLHAVYVLDRYEKEPIRNLVRYLAAGAGAGVAAAFIEVGVHVALGRPAEEQVGRRTLEVLIAGGGVEEGVKLLALVSLARRDRELNEPFDWIVYSVSVALGFAALENLAYVMQEGATAGVLRAFTAVPSHALDGTLMGYHLAVASMVPGPHATRAILAFVEPALWHGAYDALIEIGVANPQAASIHSLWLALVVAEWRVGVRRVQRLRTERPGRRVPPIFYPLLPFKQVQWPERRPSHRPHPPRSRR